MGWSNMQGSCAGMKSRAEDMQIAQIDLYLQMGGVEECKLLESQNVGVSW